jgi:cellulose biosynthesis protein BcsQ
VIALDPQSSSTTFLAQKKGLATTTTIRENQKGKQTDVDALRKRSDESPSDTRNRCLAPEYDSEDTDDDESDESMAKSIDYRFEAKCERRESRTI